MAQPTPSDVHVNVPLTNISIAFLQDQRQFIADQVFPNIPVQQQANRYYTYDKNEWWRSQAEERAPATESAGSGFKVDNTPTYFCRTYAIHKDIDDQLRANADPVLDLDRDGTEFVSFQLLLKREKLWVTKYFGSGIWTGDQTGVAGAPGANQFTQWSDYGASTPIEDVRAQRRLIQLRTGRLPNVLVLGPTVYDKLVDHPDIIDRYKYTQRGILTPELLAGVFDVDRVLIPGGVENTAAENLSATLSFLYGKSALLAYAAPSPSLLQPSAGYTFSWTGYLGAGPGGNRIMRFRMQPLRSDRIEGEMSFDLKVVAVDCAVFFGTAVA